MSVEQRVAAFLRDHRRDGAYCDACIAGALRLGAGENRSMARNATAALAATADFRRGPGRCSRCGEDRLATHCVA
jgi:hypothetical protein